MDFSSFNAGKIADYRPAVTRDLTTEAQRSRRTARITGATDKGTVILTRAGRCFTRDLCALW